MFERYTEKARRVIFFARYEASQFGCTAIETEHLLLGVLREDKAVTSRYIRGSNSYDSVREEIERQTPKREKVSTSVDMPLSEESRRALDYAAEEADALGHKHIGTEHLLLALLHEEKSFSAKLLHDRGLRLSSLREALANASREEESADQPRDSVLLSDFSIYLTRLARMGRLSPLIGRDGELEHVIHNLSRSGKNNVVLVGEPGVGKRTIVEGLVQRVASGKATASLEGKIFVGLDLSLVVAAAHHSAHPQDFLKAVAKEITANGERTIYYFDELFALLGAGVSGGAHEISTVLKAGLSNGKIRCIAVATPEEYQAATSKANWLAQCFRPVKIQPATEVEAHAVLVGIKGRFEEFHSVRYTDDALAGAIKYSGHFAQGHHLPERAVDLIDDAGALVKMKLEKAVLPEEVIAVRKRLKFVSVRHENAVNANEFEKARFYSDEERKLREEMRQLEEKHGLKDSHIGTVTREHIEEILARSTGLTIAAIREKVERADKPPKAGGGSAERPQPRKKSGKKKK